ncbi:MAG: Riboflavin biosynthesis protein RibD [Alphaproteobacteria bacterium MarineAlpha5_Bin9]|nr:MAG: Riboflavin biosynthesis protein RibD [Alphaproteobacteria bacterium MarineAlpha5_Bin9]
MQNNNIKFLKIAHQLAKSKSSKTFPSPTVGCVIVNNKKIVAKGVTGIGGRPHAEEIALKYYNKSMKNSKLYVTLEPCFHKSRNGSCAKQIINSNIKEVFIASKDPDLRTHGRTINLFKRNKIKTTVGLTKELTEDQNKFFFYSVKHKLPFVKVKMAISKDFKIAKKNYESKWISNYLSRQYGHKLRYNSQAILTTAKTIIHDNPKLTVRLKNKKTIYKNIIVIDKNLKIPLNSKILVKNKKRKVFIFTNKNNKKAKELDKLGCKIIFLKIKKHDFNLKEVLKKIYKLNITNLLVEAGGIFFSNLFKANLVNELHLFRSEKKIGINGKDFLYNISFTKIQNQEKQRKNFKKDLYQYFYLR